MAAPNRLLKELRTTTNSSELRVDWEGHLEALPLATWIGDPAGDNIFVNRAYRELLGVTHLRQVEGRLWADLVHPEDRPAYNEAWQDFVEGRSQRFLQRVRWIRPVDGREINLVVRAQKLEHGQIQGWLRTDVIEQALSKLEGLT